MRNRQRIWILLICILVLALACPAALAQGRVLPPSAGASTIVRFTGEVKSRPGDSTLGVWVVADRSFTAVEATMIDESQGAALVGSQVMVIAKRVTTAVSLEASLEAVLIRVLDPSRLPRSFVVRGIVMELQPAYLVVNGLRIGYDSTTPISGELTLGALVKVVVTRTDGGVKALRIEVLPTVLPIVEFEGAIRRLSRELWVVGERRVRLTSQTVIDGTPIVGATARVRGLVGANRVVLALVITIQSGSGTVEWTARIDRLPYNITIYPPVYTGRWVVGGREVWVTTETVITGTPRIGARAHVVAVAPGARRLRATNIEVLTDTD